MIYQSISCCHPLPLSFCSLSLPHISPLRSLYLFILFPSSSSAPFPLSVHSLFISFFLSIRSLYLFVPSFFPLHLHFHSLSVPSPFPLPLRCLSVSCMSARAESMSRVNLLIIRKINSLFIFKRAWHGRSADLLARMFDWHIIDEQYCQSLHTGSGTS